MKYRKKPKVIEAFQLTKASWTSSGKRWPQWALDAWDKDPSEGAIWVDQNGIYCGTLEGVHEVSFDDWIIKGVEGEIYPCKPSVFEATYEAVSEPQTEQKL